MTSQRLGRRSRTERAGIERTGIGRAGGERTLPERAGRLRVAVLSLLLLGVAACSDPARPVSVARIDFGAGAGASVSIQLARDYVDGSLEVRLDGQLVTGAFARTLTGAAGAVAAGDGGSAHELAVSALFPRSGSLQRFDDRRSFVTPVRTPALLSSTPVQGAKQVVRSAWLRLDFASAVPADAKAYFSFACDDGSGEAPQPFTLHALSASTLVANPEASLPAAALCVLRFFGPAGPQGIVFRTAAAGAPAHAAYDRSDPATTHPFPDDYWTGADATSLTGLRPAMPIPARSQDVQAVFSALLPETHALDGWSPLAPIVLELSDAPDPSSLPLTPAESLDPLATIGLFDLDPASASYGRRFPFRTEVRNDVTSAARASHSLLLFPSVPFTPRGRYGVVITRRAFVDATRPLEPSAFFAAALGPATPGEPAATTRVRELAGEVLDVVGRAATPPIPRDDVALALRFTIRSTDMIPDDLLAIREDVFATAPPAVVITSVTPETSPTSAVAAVVRGTFDAPDYRANGVNLQRGADGRPQRVQTRPLEFTLAIPKSALFAPAPVTMYQHGNPGSQNEVLSEARDYLGAAGFAVMGFTDVLNREVAPPSTGDTTARITAQVLNIVAMLLGNQKLPDYWVETHAEQIAFLRVLEAIAADPVARDLVPIGAPDGIPDLDPSAARTYVGISEGANNGPGFLPYAPEIKAAALVVGGARLAEVMIHQQSAAFLETLPSFFPNMTPTDIWVALSLFQTLFDQQDNHNHARFLYRDRLEVAGTTRKASVLVTEGLTDSLVPNHATESLAFAFGPIPQLEPVQRPVAFLEPVAGPIAANVDAETTAAFFQFVPDGVIGIPPTPGCLLLSTRARFEGHYCAQDAAEAREQRLDFFESALVGVPVIRNPFAP